MSKMDADIAFDVMSYDECLLELQAGRIGRLAWVRAGSPIVVPVNFAWDGEAVVVRSDPGAKVAELAEHDVAFETDEIHADTRTGWSVLVVGRVTEVDPQAWPAHVTPPDQLHLHTWVPGSKSRWLRLVPNNISGRRLVAHPHETRNPFWRLSPSE